MTTTKKATFEGWAILELMGHRVLGGRVSQEEIFGRAMIRIDVPEVNDAGEAIGTHATQYYSPEAMYALTPTTEAVATRLARQRKPAPVTVWICDCPRARLSRSTSRMSTKSRAVDTGSSPPVTSASTTTGPSRMRFTPRNSEGGEPCGTRGKASPRVRPCSRRHPLAFHLLTGPTRRAGVTRRVVAR